MRRPTSMTGVALAVMATAGCLPGDERPDPGSLFVTVQRSAAAADGFVTDDYWTVSFDRFVTGLGDMMMEGDDCIDYSGSTYDRLFDHTVTDNEKLAQHYAIGKCSVVLAVGSPSSRAILMNGVTEDDRELMNTAEMDEVITEWRAPVVMWIQGRAERNGIVKEFDWRIRRSRTLSTCYGQEDPEEVVTNIDIRTGDTMRRAVDIRPQELFRTKPSLDAPILFDPFAQADADMDDRITLAELGEVEVDVDDIVDDLLDELPQWFVDAFDPTTIRSGNLLWLMYEIHSGRVVAWSDASECQTEIIFGIDFGF